MASRLSPDLSGDSRLSLDLLGFRGFYFWEYWPSRLSLDLSGDSRKGNFGIFSEYWLSKLSMAFHGPSEPYETKVLSAQLSAVRSFQPS